MKKKLTFGMVIIFGMMLLVGCGGKSLKGEYSTEINLILVKSTHTLDFKGQTVTEIQDGKELSKGTYKMVDNQLEIELENYTMTAELSEDKKSFVVQSTDGLGARLEYTKVEK